MPGDAGAKRSVGTGWYRCWGKVPDNWATLGGRDLWVESVTLTIDSSHTAHEAFINGHRLGGAGSFPPDTKPSDAKPKRYKHGQYAGASSRGTFGRADPEDDHHSPLKAEEYIAFRVKPMLQMYQKRVPDGRRYRSSQYLPPLICL